MYEDGVKQDVTYLQQHQLADCADASHGHERKHGDASERSLRKRPLDSRARLRTQDLAEVIEFDSRASSCRPSQTTSPSSSRRSARPRPAVRLDVQRDLHRAERAEEDHRKPIPDGDPASGDRRAVGRRGYVQRCLPFEGSRSILAKRNRRDRYLRDRVALQRRIASSKGSGSRVRAAAARAANRRPGVLSRRISAIWLASTARLPMSSRASTPSATPRGTRGGTAPGARIVVRVNHVPKRSRAPSRAICAGLT